MSQRQCNHCGQRLRPSGGKAHDGVYFCMAKECQAAKARRNRRRQKAQTPVPQAPTHCSSCGVELTPRRFRAQDEFGRWCLAWRCRRARDAALAEQAFLDPTLTNPEVLRERLAFLHHAVAFPRVTCPACETEDAVDGFRHPDPDGGPCVGTGDRSIKRVDAHHVWPNRVGLPPELLSQSLVEVRRIEEIAAAQADEVS